jgi:hypothetical protein
MMDATMVPRLQVHSPPAASHATVAERQCLHMLRDTLIVHSKLDQDEIRVLWDMQREAERKVIGSDGCG